MTTATIKTRLKAITPPWLWERVHRLRSWRDVRRGRQVVARYPARVIEHSYAGVPLKIQIADPTASVWYDENWNDVTEFKDVSFLKAHRLRPGARVFDVGAHQCVIALVLADAVGPAGLVVAVEAHPHNVRVAEKNRELNHAENLTVVHAAVADRAGRIMINEVLNAKVDDRGSFGRIEVEAITIDDLAARHGTPDVAMIDIEGYEVHALRGMQRAFESRPDVLIEVHVGCGLEEAGESVASLLAAFPPEAYTFSIAAGFKDGEACDCLDFEPFSPDSPILENRFVLAAIPR